MPRATVVTRPRGMPSGTGNSNNSSAVGWMSICRSQPEAVRTILDPFTHSEATGAAAARAVLLALMLSTSGGVCSRS